MTTLISAIHRSELNIENCIVNLMKRHPNISFVLIFIGMPVFILTAIFLITMVTVLPIALLLGLV